MAYYFDTPALSKLVVAEPETSELVAWIGEQNAPAVASDLARTALLRVTRRLAPHRISDARAVLASVNLASLHAGVFELAGDVEPPDLRSLDAIHLASALDLGPDLEGIVTYDLRLAMAARSHGVEVYCPGSKL